MRNRAECWPAFLFAMRPITLTIGGKQWVLKRPKVVLVDGEECDGACDCGTRTVEVQRDLTGLTELRVVLHELDHATGEFLAEEHVDSASEDKARAVWRLNYRRLTKEQMKILGIS
jgi:hypothetical protein